MPIFNTMHHDISDETKPGYSMRQDRNASFDKSLITAVFWILLLILPGIAFAETLNTSLYDQQVTTTLVPNISILSTTPVPPVYLVFENVTTAVDPRPLIIFDTPVIQDLNCTIYGVAEPGSINVTIQDIRW